MLLPRSGPWYDEYKPGNFSKYNISDMVIDNSNPNSWLNGLIIDVTFSEKIFIERYINNHYEESEREMKINEWQYLIYCHSLNRKTWIYEGNLINVIKTGMIKILNCSTLKNNEN